MSLIQTFVTNLPASAIVLVFWLTIPVSIVFQELGLARGRAKLLYAAFGITLPLYGYFMFAAGRTVSVVVLSVVLSSLGAAVSIARDQAVLARVLLVPSMAVGTAWAVVVAVWFAVHQFSAA